MFSADKISYLKWRRMCFKDEIQRLQIDGFGDYQLVDVDLHAETISYASA